MPQHNCVAADCKTIVGMGYSLHKFPKDKSLKRRWISAVKQQRKDWNSPSPTSVLCSKHFTEDLYETDGKLYCETFGIPVQKRLKQMPSFQGASTGTLTILLHAVVHCPKEENNDQ